MQQTEREQKQEGSARITGTNRPCKEKVAATTTSKRRMYDRAKNKNKKKEMEEFQEQQMSIKKNKGRKEKMAIKIGTMRATRRRRMTSQRTRM